MKKEMAEKLIQASSPDEMIEIVKANGQDITPEQAKALFDQIQVHSKEGELLLEDLDSVAGGFIREIVWVAPDGTCTRRYEKIE